MNTNIIPNNTKISFCTPFPLLLLQCFCFEEQRLNPQEEVDMPVFFYIDPEFDSDPRMARIDTITLSYTFFEAKEGQNLPLPGYSYKWPPPCQFEDWNSSLSVCFRQIVSLRLYHDLEIIFYIYMRLQAFSFFNHPTEMESLTAYSVFISTHFELLGSMHPERKCKDLFYAITLFCVDCCSYFTIVYNV